MKLESDSSELGMALDSLGTGIHWLIVSFFASHQFELEL